MSLKIISLVGLGLSTVSFVAWGGFEANKNFQYNKKMEEYGQWRKKFFEKVPKDEILNKTLCKSLDECMASPDKSYFPKPNENKYWELAYNSLKVNNMKEPNNARLTYIKTIDQLTDYCYGEIKKDIYGQNSGQYFNPSGGNGTKDHPANSHDRCLLSKEELEKVIKK